MRKVLKKIISKIPIMFVHVNNEDILNSTDWIISLEKMYRKLVWIFPKYKLSLHLNEYINKVQKLLNIDRSNFDIIKKCWLNTFDSTDEDTKFFFSKAFYLFEIFDNEIAERVVKYALETQNPEHRYWTTMDISKMTFLLQKGFYSNFYNDRKILLKMISKENINIYYEPILKQNNKICIIVYMLSPSMNNSMQRVASMVANGLYPYFSEIEVLAIGSFFVSNKEKHQLNTLFRMNLKNIDKRDIEKLFEQKIKITYIDGNSFSERINNTLTAVINAGPKVILDISDEYSAVSYNYSQLFPTLYIPMRGYASSIYFNKILGRLWKYEVVNKEFNCIQKKQVIDWIFPEYVPPVQQHFTRREMGLMDSQFIIMSIGNNDKVFDKEFIELMRQFLDSNKMFVWLLVGAGAPLYLHNKYKYLIERRQVIEWGFESNLSALCENCNVLLRANTTGGSGGTAIAAMNGLPIVMTNFVCDPMRWLGQNFSELKSYEDIISELKHLYLDKSYYQEKSLLAKDKVYKAIDSRKIWRELADIIKKEF